MKVFSILNFLKKTRQKKAVEKVLADINRKELKVDMIGTHIFRVNMRSLLKSEVVKEQLEAASKSIS